jgi:pilus assembly protein CpaB
MSRNLAAISPGRANRRFILLAVVLGLLGAILVYVAASRDSTSGGGGKAAGDTPVVVAKVDIPARTKITQSMVEVRLVPENTVGEFAYTSAPEAVGQVTRFPIAANEQILQSKVVQLTGTSSAASRSLSFVVPPGKRGIAINVSQVQGAGGLVLPGDYVDILLLVSVEFETTRGDFASREKVDNYLVMTLFQNIEVLAVSQTVVDVVAEATPTTSGQRVRNSEARPDPGAATVTLALTPEQAQRIYLAEANGVIRLDVRRYGEAEERPIEPLQKIDLLPPNLPNPFLR